jgi:hypothetical protein
MYVCMNVCMYVCMYVCMQAIYVKICVYAVPYEYLEIYMYYKISIHTLYGYVHHTYKRREKNPNGYIK